jgi:hypothetical protein
MKLEKVKRTDSETAREVEKAIRIAEMGFVQDAALVCGCQGVPLDVAMRVLTRPAQRRQLLKNNKGDSLWNFLPIKMLNSVLSWVSTRRV